VADVPSGLSLTPPIETKKKLLLAYLKPLSIANVTERQMPGQLVNELDG
jgi:hypothetical protein